MMTSRASQSANAGAIVFMLVFLLIGCGRGAPEHAEPAAATAQKTPEGAAAGEHHDEPTVVELSPEALARAGIRVEAVRSGDAGQLLIAPAELQPNADRIARVGPRVAGRIARVLVSLGANVRAGQPLATIRSPEAAEAAAALDSARAAENLARQTLARERELFQRKVSAQREVLEAEAALASAEAAVRATGARLASMGFDTDSGKLQRNPVVTITSPLAGTVIERTAAADAPVGPESVLFTVADLSSLWLTVRVPETSASSVRTGQPVSVIVGAIPDKPVEGRIDYIAPMVVPETRTVDVRVQVPNRSRELRPGMSASARFDLAGESPSTARSETHVLVPRTAVQELNQSSVVFVPTGERQFKPQVVTLGSTYGTDVEVVSGLKVGDRIVVQGAFTLKAQAMRGAVADPH